MSEYTKFSPPINSQEKILERPRCYGKDGDIAIAASNKITQLQEELQALRAKERKYREALEVVQDKLQGEISGVLVNEPIRHSVLISARDVIKQALSGE